MVHLRSSAFFNAVNANKYEDLFFQLTQLQYFFHAADPNLNFFSVSCSRFEDEIVKPFSRFRQFQVNWKLQKQWSTGVLWKRVLQNFAKFKEKHLCWSFFLTKLFRKRLQHKFFPVNFAKLLRTPLMAASAAQRVHYLSTGPNLSTVLPNHSWRHKIFSLGRLESSLSLRYTHYPLHLTMSISKGGYLCSFKIA